MTKSPWCIAALVLLLSACHNPGAMFMPKPKIEIKERQNPRQAYQIVMTIENAPGPFRLVEGSAQYDVINHDECGYIDPVSETISRIDTHPPIEWKPMGDSQYVATVYADLIVDEDYYGRGVCHWKLSMASALLKATGVEAETRFLPAISAEEIIASVPRKLYFWGGYYPDIDMSDFADLGQKDLSNVPAEKLNEFFSITVARRDLLP